MDNIEELVNEANKYLLDRYPMFSKWHDLTQDQKVAAIMDSLYILDTLDYIGTKCSVDQLHKFPRLINGKEQTPLNIKLALYEQAKVNVEGEYNPNVTQVKLGDISYTYTQTKEHLYYVTSLKARMYLLPYIKRGYRIV